MGRHELREPETPAPAPVPVPVPAGMDLTKVLRRNVLALALANSTVSAAFLFVDPGTAPSLVLLQAIAPLPAWGVAYGIVAALLAARRPLPAHTIAVVLWTTWAVGGIIGLAGGSTRSPAVTVALTGMILTLAGLHANGLRFRRREAQARRAA